MRVVLLALLVACGGGDTLDDPVATPPTGATGGGTTPAAYEPQCDPPGPSLCGDEGAVLRGTVRFDDALDYDGRTRGDVFVALAHEWLGEGASGGFPHIQTVIEDVDLADGPVAFALDMCEGGMMWSEENCSYQLLAILDLDGDQSVSNYVPDRKEPAGRIVDLDVSCGAESPCLDLVLDCVGPDCVAFDDPGQCDCAEVTCHSDIVTCL